TATKTCSVHFRPLSGRCWSACLPRCRLAPPPCSARRISVSDPEGSGPIGAWLGESGKGAAELHEQIQIHAGCVLSPDFRIAAGRRKNSTVPLCEPPNLRLWRPKEHKAAASASGFEATMRLCRLLCGECRRDAQCDEPVLDLLTQPIQ